MVKAESVPVGDIAGHFLFSMTRRAFIVFENAEVANQRSVLTGEMTKESGASPLQYATMTFSDGSTIILKAQVMASGPGVLKPTSAKVTSQIVKGTGRFEGIKGTGTLTVKYFPVEEGEAGARGVGEGTINYTLSSK